MNAPDKLHTAPSGKNILAALVNLLADQEGINITYEFEKGEKNHGNRDCNH